MVGEQSANERRMAGMRAGHTIDSVHQPSPPPGRAPGPVAAAARAITSATRREKSRREQLLTKFGSYTVGVTWPSNEQANPELVQKRNSFVNHGVARWTEIKDDWIARAGGAPAPTLTAAAAAIASGGSPSAGSGAESLSKSMGSTSSTPLVASTDPDWNPDAVPSREAAKPPLTPLENLDMDDEEIWTCLEQSIPFPKPIPLPALVEYFAVLWEDDDGWS